jgi:hypothetical protein
VFELSFALARQVFYHGSHTSSSSRSDYFGAEALLFFSAQVSLDTTLLFKASHTSSDDRHAPSRPAFFSFEMGSQGIRLIFCNLFMCFLG